MRVLVTCPPMLGMIDEFRPLFAERGVALTPAKVVQTLSEDELCALLPGFDGWIIGDDPATRRVFEAGFAGRTLRIDLGDVDLLGHIEPVRSFGELNRKGPVTHRPRGLELVVEADKGAGRNDVGGSHLRDGRDGDSDEVSLEIEDGRAAFGWSSGDADPQIGEREDEIGK